MRIISTRQILTTSQVGVIEAITAQRKTFLTRVSMGFRINQKRQNYVLFRRQGTNMCEQCEKTPASDAKKKTQVGTISGIISMKMFSAFVRLLHYVEA